MTGTSSPPAISRISPDENVRIGDHSFGQTGSEYAQGPANDIIRPASPADVDLAHPFAAQTRTTMDEPLKRLARALGRQAARQQIARGTSILEIALLLALVASAAMLLAWSRS